MTEKKVEILNRETIIKKNKNINSDWIEITNPSNILPSQGKQYPKGFSIKIRRYTYADLDYINSDLLNADIKKQTLFYLQSIDTSFPIEDLVFYDYVFINLLRKIATWDNACFTLTFTCPLCGKENINNVIEMAGGINTHDLAGDVDSLPICVEINNKHLEFSLYTVSDYIFLNENSLETSVIHTTAIRIKNMEYNEAVEFLKTIDKGEDIDIIALITSMLNLNKTVATPECKHCKKKVDIALTEVLELSAPFHINKKSLRDRLVFGKK